MINHKTRKIPLLVIMLIITALIWGTASFAWFAKLSLTPTGGEVMPGFYAGGHGTKEEPYLITKPIHLYNLAWLQAKGTYNVPAEGATTITQTYFELAADLDMTGYTLPPIGTSEYPFLGIFQSTPGNKYTIENLTVSNIVDNGEVVKRPQGVSDIEGAEIVGMFGVVGQYNDVPTDVEYSSIVPYINNFFLQNPTIRTQTDKSLLGLIAGYVNGKVHEVGVLGGSIVSGEKNSAGLEDDVISYYGLIGDRAEGVGWHGVSRPGEDGGGAIKVDVSDTTAYEELGNSTLYNAIRNMSSTGQIAVPGSLKDSSFIVNKPTTGSVGLHGRHFFNTLITSSNQKDTTVGDVNGKDVQGEWIDIGANDYNETWVNNVLNSNGANFIYNPDLEAALARGNVNTISHATAPSPTAVRNITLSDGSPLSVPANGVWFKPQGPGHCLIVFLIDTKSNTPKRKSIYKYSRTNGNIDASTWCETEFEMNRSLGNKCLVVFEYEITQADIDAHCEFVIGSSESYAGNDVHFYFLALAGASQQGNGSITDTSLEMFNVNFINELPYQYNDGAIAGPGMLVTTFYIELLENGETAISFDRNTMLEHAVSTYDDADFTVTRYEHTVPPNTGQ